MDHASIPCDCSTIARCGLYRLFENHGGLLAGCVDRHAKYPGRCSFLTGAQLTALYMLIVV